MLFKNSPIKIQSIAIRTLGMLGKTGNGVATMQQHGILRPFIDLVIRSLGELRVPCLEALMLLFEIR
jgi:hypothetical protein